LKSQKELKVIIFKMPWTDSINWYCQHCF